MKKNLFLNIENSLLDNLLDVLFNSHPEIDLYKISKENLSANKTQTLAQSYLVTDKNEVLSYLRDNEIHFKKVFFIGKNLEDKTVTLLDPSTCSSELLSYFKNQNESNTNPQNIYNSIPLRILRGTIQAPSDLYFLLNKNDKDNYVKRYKRDDIVLESEIDKYLKKSQTSMYYMEKDKALIENFTKSIYLNSLFNDNSLESIEESVNAVKYMFKEFGINLESIDLIHNLSSSIIERIEQIESSQLIKEALEKQSDIFFKKALITTTIGASIIKSSNYLPIDAIEKISNLSLLTDIYLKEDMCLINTNEKLLQSSYSDEEKDLILTHAKKAHQLIQDDKTINNQLKNSILNHHGMKDGIGFKEELDLNETKIITLFRVCEDFSIELIQESNKGNYNVVKIYEYMKNKYQHSTHQELLKHAFFSIYAIMKAS